MTHLLALFSQEQHYANTADSQEGFMTQRELFTIIIWFPVRSQRIYEANWPSFWSCLYQNFPCGLLEHGPGVASGVMHAVCPVRRMWEQVALAVIQAATRSQLGI